MRREQIAELRQLVQMVGRTIQSQQLEQNDENQTLFDIVVDYTYALDTTDVKGFSDKNLWRMKQFYETYCQADEKLSAVLRQIE